MKTDKLKKYFQGVPDIVDLVHNEKYKENALEEFAEKLRDLL